MPLFSLSESPSPSRTEFEPEAAPGMASTSISHHRRCEIGSDRRQNDRGFRDEAESGSGKRDGYDIDKMGSFGLWFGDATNSAGRSWWNGFSRLESRRGANAVVRESGRLPSIRGGFAGYS